VDFIVDLVVQLFAQIFLDVAGDYVFRRRTPRRVAGGRVSRAAGRVLQYGTTVALAIAFGIGWGQHLSGSPHRPKLLWVSLALGAAAALLALRRTSRRTPYGDDLRWAWSWRTVLTPPWRWPRHRLIGFALVSTWIAIGIVLGYKPPAHRVTTSEGWRPDRCALHDTLRAAHSRCLVVSPGAYPSVPELNG
jgi:hypothetical protein